MHKMIKLTNKHKKHGYYKLPGVNRPINPRDLLGLWNVYYAERHELKEENTKQNSVLESMIHINQSRTPICLQSITKEVQ